MESISGPDVKKPRVNMYNKIGYFAVITNTTVPKIDDNTMSRVASNIHTL